jgi:hypothetical protein
MYSEPRAKLSNVSSDASPTAGARSAALEYASRGSSPRPHAGAHNAAPQSKATAIIVILTLGKVPGRRALLELINGVFSVRCYLGFGRGFLRLGREVVDVLLG